MKGLLAVEADSSMVQIPQQVQTILYDFEELILDELPDVLPPMRNI